VDHEDTAIAGAFECGRRLGKVKDIAVKRPGLRPIFLSVSSGLAGSEKTAQDQISREDVGTHKLVVGGKK